MKTAFIILKLIAIISGSVGVFFTGIFYLGGAEQLKETLSNGFWTFFWGRFGMSFSVAILFYAVSLLLNFIFRSRHGFDRKKIRRIALIELSYFFLLSLAMTIFFFRNA